MAKILIVDDDLATNVVVAKTLQAQRHDTRTAFTAEEALAKVTQEAFDLIVTDLKLPKLSGLALLKRLADARILERTPTIVLTGTADADARVRAREMGAIDYILKPFDVQDFALRIRRALERRALSSPAATAAPPAAPAAPAAPLAPVAPVAPAVPLAGLAPAPSQRSSSILPDHVAPLPLEGGGSRIQRKVSFYGTDGKPHSLAERSTAFQPHPGTVAPTAVATAQGQAQAQAQAQGGGALPTYLIGRTLPGVAGASSVAREAPQSSVAGHPDVAVVRRPDCQGVLGRLTAFELARFLHGARKSGVLELESGGFTGEVVFRDGEIVRAFLARDREQLADNVSAVKTVLAWTSGQFRLNIRAVACDGALAQPTAELLVEMAARAAELRARAGA